MPTKGPTMEKDYEQGLVRALHLRERSLDERERFVTDREMRIGMRELRANEREEADHHRMSQIRAANEELVLAGVHADQCAESALERMQASDAYVAMLSHELRNPLAPIVTALDLMDLTRATAFQRERDVIRRHVVRLVAVVSELLDVVSAPAHEIVLGREACSLADIVAAAVDPL